MPQKLTQEQFIQRSNKKHNNEYDYSLTNYESIHKKVEIICKAHGVFKQTPYGHLHLGQGCKKCGLEYRSQGRTKTIQDFIKEAKEVHGEKYDYSNSVYVLSKIKLEIICKKHGPFLQTPDKHILQKCGCPKCKKEAMFLTQNEFVEKAKLVHGERYDYSLSRYTNTITPVTIICHEHGEFLQKPNVHLSGANCPACVGCQKLTTERFIELSNLKHNSKYTYENSSVLNSNSIVEITCSKHGPFWQAATSHCHDGTGCPKCSKKISKKETAWLDFLNIPNDPQHRQVYIKLVNKKTHVDGYDPNTKTVYEFLGDFWHGNPKLYNPTDFNTVAKKSFHTLHTETFKRFDLMKQSGYNVVYIWESDFKSMQHILQSPT